MDNQQFLTSQPMQPASAASDSAYPYASSYAQEEQSPYMNSQAYHARKWVKEETALTKSMKRQFPFFGLASAVYAVFYAFCLYKNASGITYPFFAAGTLCYFFLSMKKLGVPFKKDSLFYMISIVLLGISNCCTVSLQLLGLNKLGIFLLSFILMLHAVYQDKSWGIPKYICAFFRTLNSTRTCFFSAFTDMVSFFDARKREKNGEESVKESKITYIIIGLALSIPVLALMTSLLCSADAVFKEMISRLLSFDFLVSEDFPLSEFLKIGLLITAVFFISYALIAALCKKDVTERVSDNRIFEPIIAIVTTGMLSAVYLMFGMIQILYLFVGNMRLPDGYTYSSYARQGFFQLLAVCILNLILVLLCLSFFRDNMVLKIILTVISGCTFIMILSSALRMLMYIEVYNLTFLRVFVLWALAVIFLLMAGVTAYIHFRRFPLFTYSVAVTTVFYIALSFAHPDYWIARYNLDPSHIICQDCGFVHDSDLYYTFTSLSADAAPVLLNEETNPYLNVPLQTMEEFAALEKQYGYGSEHFSYDKYKELHDEIDTVIKESIDRSFYYYYKGIYNKYERMHIRSFNFSIFFAKRSAGL